MMNYVLGFLFNSDRTQVKLIRKLRPDWQYNRLNGIGGKIEPGETAVLAMEREFLEEAGVVTVGWKKFAYMASLDWQCSVFSLADDNYFREAYSKTDEVLEDIKVNELLSRSDCISNLHWLIPLARNPKDIQLPVWVGYE